MNNLVSIVIPTYSRNDTLVRAITSALNQTHKNIEILVIDDNPVDSEWRKSTSLLMEQYKDDSRIRYIQHAVNLGGSGARNTGIKEAKGEYIAFLDDDDEYLPEKVEKQLNKFISENDSLLGLVYCFSEYFENGKIIFENRNEYRGNCLYEAMRENCIANTSQWMVKKEIAEKIGGFPIVPSKQDSQFLLRLLDAGYKLDYVPEVLLRYCMDANFTHISNNGRKPLEGELLYRTECRKLYYKLDFNQIMDIEYSFSKALFVKYMGLNDKVNANKEKQNMYRISKKDAYKYFLKERLRSVKNSILKGKR
ncbi:MAG: glycosyltransferase family 2 protein [Bacillota bacterium]|nr:glycosyltransferase family 2 protein [Bacillota bacterium]